MAATMFIHQAAGCNLWVGGREAAESLEFLEAQNIRFVVSMMGKHSSPAVTYPKEASDDFKTFKFPIGYEGQERTRSFEVCSPMVMVMVVVMLLVMVMVVVMAVLVVVLMVMLMLMLIVMLMLMLIPIERCTSFVLDPKVGEGENAVPSLFR